MKKYSFYLVALMCMCSSIAFVSCTNEKEQQAAAADRAKVEKFLQQAVANDRFELMAGMMAADQGKTDEVDAFGQKLVQVHSRTSPVLETMAKSRRVKIPEEMPVEKKAIVDSLEAEEGAAFDGKFVIAQLAVQQETVALYEKADKEVADQEVQAFIDQVLPVLKEHLAAAQELKNTLAMVNPN